MSDTYKAITDLFGAFQPDVSSDAEPLRKGHNADESDQLGRLSLESGNYSEAIAHFKNAVNQREPGDISSRLDLAGAYETADQFPQAYRQYEKALAIRPDSAEAQAGIADLKKRYGKFRESIDHLQRALGKDPENAFLNFKLAETLREAGAPKSAMEYAVNAIIAKPDDDYFHFWVGDLNIQLGFYEEALQSLRAAVELSPGDDYYYLRCVVPFWLLGKKTEAIKSVRLASELDPTKNLYYGLLEELLRANDQFEEADLEMGRSSKMDRYDEEVLERMLDELKIGTN
jgi:tetratricopeptide (TPR) repeat protein